MRISHALVLIAALALAPLMGRAQWVQTNGPNGGTINCIDTLGSNIFIGTNGGVFESTDSGSSWQRKSNGIPLGSYIYSLVRNDSTLFAGIYQYGAYRSVVYRSMDGGANWIPVFTGFPDTFRVSAIGISARAIYSLDGMHSFKSMDDGVTWSILDTNLTKVSEPHSILTVDSVTYVAGNWITETTDDGVHWGIVAIPPTNSSWNIICMANLGQALFADQGDSEILRSTNQGKTWDVMGGLPNGRLAYHLAAIGRILFASADNGYCYRTIDSARSWQLDTSALPMGPTLTALASNGSELFGGFDGTGIFRSLDSGMTWSECNQGLISTAINAITSTGDTTLVGTNDGIFLSTDHGTAWQQRNDGLTNYNVASLFIDGEKLFAGMQGYSWPALYYSTDWGVGWSQSDSGLALNVRSIIRSGSNLIAGCAYYGIYLSTDQGLSWHFKFTFTNSAIDVILKFGATLIASADYGIFRSTDNGFDWGGGGGGLRAFQTYTPALVAVGSKLLLNCSLNSSPSNLGLYISNDSGLYWEPVLDSVAPLVSLVTSFASIGDNIFAATDSDGIFLSTDFGSHWERENSGLGDSSILSLAVQGDELLAGTANSGVWRRPLKEMIPPSSVTNCPALPDSISVYPNPAGNDVTVSAPEFSGVVNAKLISETGAVVWQKNIGMSGAVMRLDLSSVLNGTYVLELKFGTMSHSCKLVLAR